ncbi:MAG TPA: DUF1926 domain-containing protein [Candidatus Hydrogenedens sp.]|nr:DUF1926 domain-containing protein [Candidatus Hydrogenedens sp.]HPP59157.1 DUF1926 domain-containing protein [Candidatus Hydrogenedens sp.]
MKSLNLIFALHSHQPVGNFEFVFEEAYQKAYLPFLKVLQQFPNIKVTLHITGPLWDWFDVKHPEFYELINTLIQRKQVELMGGAFYEPLVCAIPEEDAYEQILYMQDFIKQRFGVKPRGMWIAERVWEPYFPRILANAGIEYTTLDDTHFLSAGLDREELFGYYLTEHEGFNIKIFPILEKLRYTIPFRPIKETLEFLRKVHETHSGACAVFHDDGEKFGIWPGTHHSVYEEKWLFNFFTSITEEQEWLRTTTYSEYLDENPPLGRVYLPCASYHEMMEWVLPVNSQKEYLTIKKELQENPKTWERISIYLRGGFWRGFLSKYEEANNMQKRMLKTSRRLNTLIEKNKKNNLLKEAQKKLFQSQCNCAYWHGVFGGLYLNHLRTAVYSNIIECEKLIDNYEHFFEHWRNNEVEDFNCDGNDEIILNTKLGTFILSPHDGGTLIELDYKPKAFNCLNILSRREEAYHQDLFKESISHEINESGHKSIHELVKAKEKGLEKLLIYDPYVRYSMRDHFLPLNISINALQSNQYQEWWSHFNKEYSYKLMENEIILEGIGTVEISPFCWNVNIVKYMLLNSEKSENMLSFLVKYDITNMTNGEFEGYFGSEWCFNLLTGSSDDRFIYSKNKKLSMRKLGDAGDESGLTHFALRDDWQKLEIEFQLNKEARLFNFPIETVSQSENGQERVYQGNVLIPCWKGIFRHNEVVSIEMKINIKSL